MILAPAGAVLFLLFVVMLIRVWTRKDSGDEQLPLSSVDEIILMQILSLILFVKLEGVFLFFQRCSECRKSIAENDERPGS